MLRPLAGFWFLNSPVKGVYQSNDALIPSPCGVLVLKFGFKQCEAYLFYMFPSPCGVLVLKWIDKQPKRARARVSVPLRGSGS